MPTRTIYLFDDLGNKVAVGTYEPAPVSLTVGGSWTNTQYTGSAPDPTGLTFTCTFSDGTSSSVVPTSVSPSTWSSTAGTQTATFSYTSGGVTVSATKMVTVKQPPKSVGGIIFYIDSTADGTYTFYNAQGTQVSAPTVGMDCSGWKYTVSGATKDKFYVVYNELYTSKKWTYYSNGAYVYTSTGATGTAKGTGKTNTAIIMSADNGAYITSNSNGYPTVWYQIQQMRTNKVGGCDDWFVGSKYELDSLRLSGAGNSATWFSSNYIWSSSESAASNAWDWNYVNKNWSSNYLKGTGYCVCGIRAF